ncbi:MAG: iron dicitrate transport regulator FecR [Rhodospirillales bacterium]|nr:iron dicitrate transport regulator FecR [Rhodospirillales bacterium]
MAREAAESGAAARRQIARCGPGFAALGERLRALKPRLVVTCARGSSDHAAYYGKYLIETRLGLPVASIGPSIASLYDIRLQLDGALFIVVSQSGRSPDLLRLVASARDSGALVVGFVNDETSPLATSCDIFLPLCAGPEISVAATKSYLMSAFAFLQLAAHWRDDAALHQAVAATPQAFDDAMRCDWSDALARLTEVGGLYVIARGLGNGAALEMALKCKETCRLHAEAFSAAEVIHGPLALVGPGFPVIALTQHDATEESNRAVIERMVSLGAPVLSTAAVNGTIALPTVPNLAAEIAPLAQVLSFYLAIHKVARARGLDPDTPPNLKKVTETV